MDTALEIERFAEKPDQLLKLFRDLVEYLQSEDDHEETSTMGAQLKEISRAIEKLEKMGIAVPDAFRAEKTRLAVASGTQTDSLKKLNYLTVGLEEILKVLQIRTGRNLEPLRKKRISKPRSSLPRTDKSILRALILDALLNLGGSAPKHDVIKYMEKQLEGKLLPGDLEWRESTRDHAWQNNSSWERFAMIKEGILKSDSPKGLWELSEDPR